MQINVMSLSKIKGWTSTFDTSTHTVRRVKTKRDAPLLVSTMNQLAAYPTYHSAKALSYKPTDGFFVRLRLIVHQCRWNQCRWRSALRLVVAHSSEGPFSPGSASRHRLRFIRKGSPAVARTPRPHRRRSFSLATCRSAIGRLSVIGQRTRD